MSWTRATIPEAVAPPRSKAYTSIAIHVAHSPNVKPPYAATARAIAGLRPALRNVRSDRRIAAAASAAALLEAGRATASDARGGSVADAAAIAREDDRAG